jgi:hypothetical protein
VNQANNNNKKKKKTKKNEERKQHKTKKSKICMVRICLLCWRHLRDEEIRRINVERQERVFVLSVEKRFRV